MKNALTINSPQTIRKEFNELEAPPTQGEGSIDFQYENNKDTCFLDNRTIQWVATLNIKVFGQKEMDTDDDHCIMKTSLSIQINASFDSDPNEISTLSALDSLNAIAVQHLGVLIQSLLADTAYNFLKIPLPTMTLDF